MSTKGWEVQGKPNDSELVKEYYQAIVKKTWVDKLPTRVVRWSVFTGLGVGVDLVGAGGLGTVAGVVLSAFDAAIVEQMIAGWKPHHFVEGPLRSFIPSKGKER
ncbi:MAG: hypothetical protein Q7U39_05565 [Nitrospira sp.]|nr:hypothetical protein [Nitrospira sp.]